MLLLPLRRTRFISPAVSLRPGFSPLHCFCCCLFALVGDAALPEQAQGNRDLQQFLPFGIYEWVLLRSVLCGLFQLQMAGWSQQLCCGKECVVDGSIHYIGCWRFWGWGGVVLCGVGLVSLHLTGSGRVELWLRLLKRCSVPFSPLYWLTPAESVRHPGTTEEMSTELYLLQLSF